MGARITHGLLEPGARLRVGAMCHRCGVGAGPLREALSRPLAEGLVHRIDQRGCAVAPLQWAELPILARSRVQLERLALAASTTARDTAWQEQLALLLHRLSRTPRSLSAEQSLRNPAWGSLHRACHQALLARCPSRWLKAFVDSVAAEAYRFCQMAAGQSFGSPTEHAEHVAIFQAAIGGRSQDAIRLFAGHCTGTSAQVASQGLALGCAGQG